VTPSAWSYHLRRCAQKSAQDCAHSVEWDWPTPVNTSTTMPTHAGRPYAIGNPIPIRN